LVLTSVLISKEVGGNLSEIFDKIAATIRERHRIEGKIKALTAQGRLQGVVMSLLPVAVGVILKVTRPGYFEPILTTSIGWFFLGAIFLMLVLGTYFVFKIVNIEV
ncbi:MAG: type II secretion system F family protein, partial [Planctomycetes bacterium]|nr:type II secretion system F family protein [Planctomycetota bacterium]